LSGATVWFQKSSRDPFRRRLRSDPSSGIENKKMPTTVQKAYITLR
jgi:hypothetical protein